MKSFEVLEAIRDDDALEHLDAPTPESAAELRTVATHGRRE